MLSTFRKFLTSLNIIHSIYGVYVDTTESVLFRDLHRLCPRTMFCNCTFYTKAGNEHHLPTCGLCYGRYNIIWTIRINKTIFCWYIFNLKCWQKLNQTQDKLCNHLLIVLANFILFLMLTLQNVNYFSEPF